MWWAARTDSKTLSETLAPYLRNNAELDARTRALWQANGLRLISVPIDQVDTIRQLLRQSGGVQRQWLGQVPVWTDVIHGVAWPSLQAVEMDNGHLHLGAGRIRILLRCWTMPVPGSSVSSSASGGIQTAMRAEMLLQHQEPPRVDPASIYERPANVSDALSEGLVFSRLAASILLPPDRALLILPEAPEVDWRSLAQMPPDQLAAEEAALAETRSRFIDPNNPPQEDPAGTPRVGQIVRDRTDARDRSDRPLEPEIPGPVDPSAAFSRTLGELLLTPSGARLSGDIANRTSVRSILVLIPRVPEQFRIDPARSAESPNKNPGSTPG